MVIRHGAGTALNTDGAARHGLRMLRHPPIHGRSTDRAIGIAWKAIGWLATADRDRGLPPIWMLNQSGLWRPFEAGRHLTVWRSTRQASAILCAKQKLENERHGVHTGKGQISGRARVAAERHELLRSHCLRG